MPVYTPQSLVTISDQLLSTTSADIIFSSIPQGFKHLEIYATGRGDTAAATVTANVKFNSDATAANYEIELLNASANAAPTSSQVGTNQSLGTFSAASATANHVGSFTSRILDYTGTTFFKVARSEGFYRGATTAYDAYLLDCIWLSTAAITRIDIIPSAGNFIAGSRFTLYGLT